MPPVRSWVLGLSWAASLIGTLLLTLVWEMRLDGGDYRRLYPTSTIGMVIVAMLGLGGVGLWNERRKKLSLPLMLYPLMALFYLSALAATTSFFTAGRFTLSRHPPNAKSAPVVPPHP